MNCEKWLPLIEEDIDGELDPRQSEKLRAHLASCADCEAEYKLLQREQHLYSSYDRELDISPALWHGVRSRIAQENIKIKPSPFSRLREILFGGSGAPRLSPAWAALLVLAAIGLTIIVMRGFEKRPAQPSIVEAPAPSPSVTQPVPSPSVEKPGPGGGKVDEQPKIASVRPRDIERVRPAQPAQPTEAVRKQTPQQVVNDAVHLNLAAIKVLDHEIGKRRSQLDPMLIARFDAALSAVDKTIAETREAVRQHPNDPVAARYMLDAYAQKVELLKDLAGAPAMPEAELPSQNRR